MLPLLLTKKWSLLKCLLALIMAKAAALLGLLAPVMAPTGTTIGDGGRVLAVVGVMVRVQAGRQMGLAGVLGLGLALEVDQVQDMVMGLEVVVHMVVGMGLEVDQEILTVVVLVEEVAETRRLIPEEKTTTGETTSMEFESIYKVCMVCKLSASSILCTLIIIYSLYSFEFGLYHMYNYWLELCLLLCY